MAKDERSFSSLFGKAKKWAQEELKNATRVTGSPQEHHGAREANEDRLRDIDRETEHVVGTAVVESMFPGVKRFADHQEQQRDAANADRDQRARAARESNAGRASVTVSGAASGHIDALAVRVDRRDDWPVIVHVEAVDATPIFGGVFVGFSFELASLSNGRYELVDESMDSSNYELFIEPENEGWFFHPSYGPGAITVADGQATVDLVFSGPGPDRIQLHASVDLTGT